MNLTCCGTVYSTTSPTIETTETNETVTFMGRQSNHGDMQYAAIT